jgi:DNA polymerase III sliding clamp (beta) subunit (PCNA family)
MWPSSSQPPFEHTITIDRRRLTRALERVALIAEAHNSVVKLEAVGGTIAITAEADANNGKELLKGGRHR